MFLSDLLTKAVVLLLARQLIFAHLLRGENETAVISYHCFRELRRGKKIFNQNA